MDRAKERVAARGMIRERIRRKVTGSAERPRLAVFRSLKSIYAQVIDDASGQTIVSASSLEHHLSLTERLRGGGDVRHRRSRRREHGAFPHDALQALADAARENGLEF